ncbi:hypothetical protein EJB05_13721, partial [Eragrostis curvula]
MEEGLQGKYEGHKKEGATTTNLNHKSRMYGCLINSWTDFIESWSRTWIKAKDMIRPSNCWLGTKEEEVGSKDQREEQVSASAEETVWYGQVDRMVGVQHREGEVSGSQRNRDRMVRWFRPYGTVYTADPDRVDRVSGNRRRRDLRYGGGDRMVRSTLKINSEKMKSLEVKMMETVPWIVWYGARTNREEVSGQHSGEDRTIRCYGDRTASECLRGLTWVVTLGLWQDLDRLGVGGELAKKCGSHRKFVHGLRASRVKEATRRERPLDRITCGSLPSEEYPELPTGHARVFTWRVKNALEGIAIERRDGSRLWRE